MQHVAALLYFFLIPNCSYFFPLPEPDEQGRRVFITRPGVNDPSKYSQADMFKVSPDLF